MAAYQASACCMQYLLHQRRHECALRSAGRVHCMWGLDQRSAWLQIERVPAAAASRATCKDIHKVAAVWSSMRQRYLFPTPHAMHLHRDGGAGHLWAGLCTVSAFWQALRMPDKPAGRLLQLAAARAQRRLRAVDPARDVRPKHLRAYSRRELIFCAASRARASRHSTPYKTLQPYADRLLPYNKRTGLREQNVTTYSTCHGLMLCLDIRQQLCLPQPFRQHAQVQQTANRVHPSFLPIIKASGGV